MPISEFESECKICHEVDTHYTRDCPENFCFRCKQRGHWSKHCPHVKCYLCGEMGHKAKTCQKQCDVCFKTGHKTKNCPHKDSGVTFIQNPMKKRVRNESPGIVMPAMEQAPRPQKVWHKSHLYSFTTGLIPNLRRSQRSPKEPRNQNQSPWRLQKQTERRGRTFYCTYPLADLLC